MSHSKNHSVTPGTRIVLVDPDAELREVFAARLRAQGFEVDEAADGVQGAEMALAAPPAAVVSDLWMPGVSGVQLCRLLGAEAATADVPVVLRAEVDDARSRFWASHAGARRLVGKGRMGELVRTLADVIADAPEEDSFFFRLAGNADVRDRIASHLDKALFESVVAAEVRALAGATAFDRMFDSLSQLVVQLLDYRWVALITPSPSHFAIHAHRSCAAASEMEARTVLMAPESAKLVCILDDDADPALASDRTSVHDITLGGVRVGQLAFGIPPGASNDVDTIAPLVARELGAVLRLVILIEESQRLATTDGLTGLFNRRAFIEQMTNECARADRTEGTAALLVLDLDHFKSINDTFGHASGDAVLAGVAKALRGQLRAYDIVARWGGEEFVIALPSVTETIGAEVAERLRAAISNLRIMNSTGTPMPLSVSIGCAQLRRSETLDSLVDRADRAMYAAKVGGRNRVVCASNDDVERGSNPAPELPPLVATVSRAPQNFETPDVVQN